ncbi:hypothetical protein JNW90_19895 [Micromonospora sp. STR1s_5]|nr:hypothetical protein [Micromonospora sp. STR1s_5]
MTTAPTDPTMPHPRWCRPGLCDAEVPTLPAVGGMHRSEPLRLVLSLPLGDSVHVAAQLQQTSAAQLADGDASIAVQVNGGPLTLVPVDQAQLLIEHLAPMLGLTVSR